MDLNRHALEGIQLCGDPLSMPDHLFEKLIGCVFEILLHHGIDPENSLGSLHGTDSLVLKQCYYGICTLVVEIAKTNIEESSISSLLEECKWSPDRVEDFNRLVKAHKKELQIILGRLDSTHPHIVDIDWRLDSCIKSNHLEKMDRLSYLISLKTQEPGKEGSLEFSCTLEQLQDLVSKLKDASKSIEKTSQA